MKSFSTLVLTFFALAAFGQNKVCAVMSPISQFSGQPVGQLQLELGSTFPATVMDAPNVGGCLDLAGLAVSGSNLRPIKNINPSNGVSTFDLVLISKHILGTAPFTNCFQHIAADVNKNGQATTFDLVELRKIILGIYSSFPSNTSWRFIPKNCTPICSGNCPTCVITMSAHVLSGA